MRCCLVARRRYARILSKRTALLGPPPVGLFCGKRLQNTAGAHTTAGGRVYGNQPGSSELITEGDSLEEAVENVKDAVKAAIEIYEDTGESCPPV